MSSKSQSSHGPSYVIHPANCIFLFLTKSVKISSQHSVVHSNKYAAQYRGLSITNIVEFFKVKSCVLYWHHIYKCKLSVERKTKQMLCVSALLSLAPVQRLTSEGVHCFKFPHLHISWKHTSSPAQFHWGRKIKHFLNSSCARSAHFLHPPPLSGWLAGWGVGERASNT